MHSIIVVMKLVEGPQIIIISFLKPSSSDSICESFIVTISKKLRLEFLSSTFILPAYKKKNQSYYDCANNGEDPSNSFKCLTG